ncbi:AMP-binding protein [Nocardioides jiangxiensis]|uniref:AMP-binding protein n=1 Tax=Nocardioides jiangxiensis TaxID=3064524 RepID=A0ABT9AYY5_9ACTN|nr:AMP-binding protein [Nocardioides sp. WY-20]MDO7867800.1 AMP-binding protein [Nocardioides sp. WY-20]
MSVIHPHDLPAGERRGAGLVRLLARHGDCTALTGSGTADGITYAELAGRVAAFARRLGPAPRLLLLEAANDADALVAWLGALAAGSPVLLTGPGAARDGLAAAYDPDVEWGPAGLVEHRATSAHDLHPDLALLLSTSGSTGSPKLVRLSHDNLLSNARAIAEYLGIRPDDVAATTLPVHYCYGLSVVHSHLVAGATVHLTERSVTDPRFWDEARAAGVTTFPGVPHTFDMLESLGFTGTELPTLRYLTQAGGRLAPDAVRRHAARGAAHGWDLVVMYGATEATARMAFLPPHLAADAAGTIGIPIPGGSLAIEPRPDLTGDPDVGELVYRGDNVMLGYATSTAELALGRTVHELRTGDLGRQRDDGLFEVVGRCARIAKVFGLRVDLDRVERALAANGVVAAVADGGDDLVVAVAAGAARVDVPAVLRAVREATGLPPAGVRLLTPVDLPRLASGKVDYRALVAQAAPPENEQPETEQPETEQPETVDGAGVAALFAALLGKAAGPGDSFRSLGGDSLSYVEASLRLEALLGTLPSDWTARTAEELAGCALPASARASLAARPAGPVARWLGAARTVETTVLLRALAIVTIVGSHANLFVLLGGAHTLFAVLGFNYSRFHVDLPRAERTRAALRSVGRIALPAVLVIGVVATYKQGVGWKQVLLLNWLLGPGHWVNPQWRYWFIEVALLLMLAATALLAVPALDRISRRHRFAFPVALVLVGLVPRYGLRAWPGGDLDQRVFTIGAWHLGGGDYMHRAQVVFFLFALGWAAARAATVRQRLVVSALAVGSVWSFFEHEPARDAYVILGVLALLWLREVRLPARVVPLVGALASSSMWIYLVHWEIYPHLENRIPLLATLLSLLAGVMAWQAWTRGEARLRGLQARRR